MLTADALEDRLNRLSQSPRIRAQTVATITYDDALFPLRAFAWGDEASPAVYVLAGVHGDEPGGIEAALRLLESLADGAMPLTSHRLLILPCLNPSGLADSTRANRIGQDINRQFHADQTQESAAVRGFLDPRAAVLLVDLHCDRQAQGFYLFELRDERVPPLGAAVLDSLFGLGMPLEESPFFAGCTGSRGLLAPTAAELETFQGRAHGQSLSEWGRGNGIPRTYALESPAGDGDERAAMIHLAALLALFVALEAVTTSVKVSGSRAVMVCISVSPEWEADRTMMGLSAWENSAMTWRHAPHGLQSLGALVITATATMSSRPSLIALKRATRSAQTVRPNEAFSTLQPR